MRARVLWIGAGVFCLAVAWALLRPSPESPAAAAPSAEGEGEAAGSEPAYFLHANWDATAKDPAARSGKRGRARRGAEGTNEAWDKLKGVEFALPAPEEK